MRGDIEVPIDLDIHGNEIEERIIVVTDYTYHAGDPGHCSPRGDCPGCPPEDPELMDIETKWQDTNKRLTDAEWDCYGETIEEKVWDYVSALSYERED